ncbi:MAG: GDSL-type esterase/lipase family protein, partial [Nitrososphaera sp.]|nr:GDSL-type esterase/lipase family protein [Nitrososphaera sp.]
IQLNQAQLKVKENHRYTVNFRARADSPRSIIVGFAKAHEPWSNLGLWKNIELTSEWRSFQEEFVPSANEDKARIHFDVGDSDISVEFSDVSLVSVPDGETVAPDSPKRYFVSYRFNALGCRGQDFSIPRPTKMERILLLGDSYTLGVGVHERHTVANQLERLLNNNADNDGSRTTYEVINCGVSGYGTKDERIFYRLFGAKYDPNIVLLMMVWNDDSSYWEELQRGEYRSPGRLEYLSYIWAKAQEYRHRRPSPDFSESVEEIHRLDSEVRRQGTRLGVVIFRNECDYQGAYISGKTWNLLTNTVMEGLKGTDIPILDLGKALCGRGDQRFLMAHPIIDWHPNELATEIAADAILSFLQNQELLSQR